MARHQRRSDSSNARSRIVLGSAMTAVFLSGGAGVAFADGETSDTTKQVGQGSGSTAPAVTESSASDQLGLSSGTPSTKTTSTETPKTESTSTDTPKAESTSTDTPKAASLAAEPEGGELPLEGLPDLEPPQIELPGGIKLPVGTKLPAGVEVGDLVGKTFKQLKDLGLPTDLIKLILGDKHGEHPDRHHPGQHHHHEWDGHKWQDWDDECGCDDDKPWDHRDDDDCDEDEGPQRWHDQDDEDDDESDEAAKDDDEKAEKKDEVEAAKADEKADDKDEVEAAKADESTPEVKEVAVTENAAATEADATPVGSADTGDGSFLPVAPTASSWSMADTLFAAGGGLGAAALLAGAGVGVGRHRRASHRASV